MELLAGTYTRGTESQGIYRFDFDPDSGALSAPELLIESDNPSWLLRWGNGLVAVNEHGDERGEGGICVFQANGDGYELTQQVRSGGADPCHLALSADRLAVANYTGGTVALFEWAGGRIGRQVALFQPDRTGRHPRQASPHPHGVYFFSDELRVPDLGGDCIYRLDARTGVLTGRTDIHADAGPRHLSADGNYLVNELDNTVVSLADLSEQGGCVSTLPASFSGRSSTAEIQLHGGKLYVSNRGHDSIAVIEMKPALAVVQHRASGGRHPRHFLVTPDGRHLLVANRDTSNLLSIRIAPDGTLGETVAETDCPAPVHLLVKGASD
jgi:6-phosphogluconolactonase